MKILLLDIECAPNLATVWGIWQQNVALNQLLESSYTLCYAAKWYGESKIMFDSIYKTDRKTMLKSIHALMEEADVIVHYNGLRFDIPMLNKEFLEAGMHPPSPVKHIDLLRVVKSNFRFVSNKLDYVSQRLGLVPKTAKTPLKVEMALIKHLPDEVIATAHHWLILHGRYVCLARTPQCAKCTITHFCAFYQKNNKA